MNITNASNVRISDAKLDETILPSQLEVDDFYLIRLDRSKIKGVGVSWKDKLH